MQIRDSIEVQSFDEIFKALMYDILANSDKDTLEKQYHTTNISILKEVPGLIEQVGPGAFQITIRDDYSIYFKYYNARKLYRIYVDDLREPEND